MRPAPLRNTSNCTGSWLNHNHSVHTADSIQTTSNHNQYISIWGHKHPPRQLLREENTTYHVTRNPCYALHPRCVILHNNCSPPPWRQPWRAQLRPGHPAHQQTWKERPSLPQPSRDHSKAGLVLSAVVHNKKNHKKRRGQTLKKYTTRRRRRPVCKSLFTAVRRKRPWLIWLLG